MEIKHRKPNATGRSTNHATSKIKNALKPETPFSWHNREFLVSDAWRSRSLNLCKLLDFLEVDHLNHAQRENGNLIATYDQLVDYGLTRSQIRPAIEEGEFLGLLKCERGGRWADKNIPSKFRLTYYPDSDMNPATNEWKGKTFEAIKEWRKDRAFRQRAARNRKKQISGSTLRTTVVPFSELREQKMREG